MPKILDGLTIAKIIKSEIKAEISKMDTPPHLAVILCSDDQASEIYVKKKIEACKEVGIKSSLFRPDFKNINGDSFIRQSDVVFNLILTCNQDRAINGILVQLPIPKEYGIKNSQIFDMIDPMKDVDVFNPHNVGLLLQGRPNLIPCTPQGIQQLLIRSGIDIHGKKVAIINRSDVVGKPLHALLVQDQSHANATVTLCHDRTPPEMLKKTCLNADIIVVAVGIPGFLKPEMVHGGSIVVDVGINRVNGKVVGDVCVETYGKVEAYSPVPGGVGPMTVAMLLRNTVLAKSLQSS